MQKQQVGLTLIISAFLLSLGAYIVAYLPYKDIQLKLTSCVTNCPANELTPTMYLSAIMILIILITGLVLFSRK